MPSTEYEVTGYLIKVEVGEWQFKLTFNVENMLEMNLAENHNEVICAYIADDLGEEEFEKIMLGEPEFKCSMHELREYA